MNTSANQIQILVPGLRNHKDVEANLIIFFWLGSLYETGAGGGNF
jgi:hypothetical protein